VSAAAARSRLAETIAHHRAALPLTPDAYRAHYNLGLALENLGRSQEAIAAYRETLRLKPDRADARRRLDALLRRWGG